MRSKIYTLFIVLMTCNNICGIGILMDITDIRGASASYSFRKLHIGKSRIEESNLNLHVIALSFAGGLRGENSNERTFGNMGLTIGFTPHITNPIEPDQNLYTKDGERITSLDHKGLFLIGSKIRFIGEYPFKRMPSIISSYWYFEIEGGALIPNFKTENGAFGQYFESEDIEPAGFMLFNLGTKFFIIDAFAGIGFITSLYNEGYTFTHDEKHITNNPNETNHFFAQMGIGITLDLFVKSF